MSPRARPLGIALVLCACLGAAASAQDARAPLDVARVLAARYPETPSMSYIPGLAWAGALRLAAVTGEPRWMEKPRREMQPFVTGERAAIAEPYSLTSLAGHIGLFDWGVYDRNAPGLGLAAQPAALHVRHLHLDGHPALELAVAGLEDLAHAPLADLADDLVEATDHIPRLEHRLERRRWIRSRRQRGFLGRFPLHEARGYPLRARCASPAVG